MNNSIAMFTLGKIERARKELASLESLQVYDLEKAQKLASTLAELYDGARISYDFYTSYGVSKLTATINCDSVTAFEQALEACETPSFYGGWLDFEYLSQVFDSFDFKLKVSAKVPEEYKDMLRDIGKLVTNTTTYESLVC